METKLYLIEEHKQTIFEGSEIDKWKEIVAELGLTMQEELINNVKSPLPFPIMSDAEQTIYSAILEYKDKYNSFDAEAIPLSVLGLIKFCIDENHFDKIEIWYSRNNPDPLVIGKRFRDESDRTNNYNWRMNHYLIAQWGGKIKPLKELLPIYDKYMKDYIKSEFEEKMKTHNSNVSKFTFQINSFVNE